MEGRRRITLFDQMSAVDGGRNTLESIMAHHKIPPPPPPTSSQSNHRSSRTLSDIIQQDNNNNNHSIIISNAKDNKKSWNFFFKDKFFLKRSIHNNSEDAPSTSHNPPQFSGEILSRERFGECTNPNNSGGGSFRREGAVTFRDFLDDSEGDDGSECDDWDPAREGTRRLSTILSEEREAEAAASVVAVDEPVRMSLTLMDLLEENDQLGFDGLQYRGGGYEEEGEEVCERMKMEKEGDDGDEENEESRRWSIQENCCVCMVRHKGAAFIPCGHTFCRQCSRDVWVSRGHCPLCNNVILEILDLF